MPYCVTQCHEFAGVALIGYYLAAAVVDNRYIGRLRLQLLGFFMVAVLFYVSAIWYHPLTSKGGIHTFQFVSLSPSLLLLHFLSSALQFSSCKAQLVCIQPICSERHIVLYLIFLDFSSPEFVKLAYDKLHSIILLIGCTTQVYFFSSFWGQFGPNCTTFLLAGELYPTEVRTTAHGLSAGVAKLGALWAAVWFNYLDKRLQFWLTSSFNVGGYALCLLLLLCTSTYLGSLLLL